MINFLIYFTALILANSAWSYYKNFITFYKIFEKVNYFNFKIEGPMIIANTGAKDEFIKFSDWSYKIHSDIYLNFDIWALVDLHKLYWLFKFKNHFDKKNYQ